MVGKLVRAQVAEIVHLVALTRSFSCKGAGRDGPESIANTAARRRTGLFGETAPDTLRLVRQFRHQLSPVEIKLTAAGTRMT
jgi:hypothetical protein